MCFFERLVPLLFCAGALARAEGWTEQAVLQRFEEQNPLARETRARLALAEAETKGRTLWANPSLGVSHEGAGRTEFYQAAQLLPVSGRFPLIRQAGALQEQVLKAEGGYALWQARCAVRAAFYRTLAGQERERIWHEADAEVTGLITLLREREREGEGSKLDRLRAEREQVEMRVSASLAGAEVVLSRSEMLAFLPPQSEAAALTGTLASAEPRQARAEWVQRALANRLDIQAERRRWEQLKKEQQAAERLRIPEPVVNAGMKRAEFGTTGMATGTVVGVAVALPLFNKGKTEVARWSAEQEKTAARLEQMTRRVQAAVEGAWEAYALQRATRDRYRQTETTELVEIASLAYREGEISILQLLDAYRLRRDSRLRQVDLDGWAKQAQIALEAQLGEELPQ